MLWPILVLACYLSRYEILCEPVHKAVAMGGADEARGEGVEREGSSETLAGQARRVEETELLEAGGHHSHQGNLCFKDGD